MKYKSLTLIILFIVSSSVVLSSQCKINRDNPSDFLLNTKVLREKKQYDEIIDYINLTLDSSQQTWHYQLACTYALKKDTVKSFEYLHQAINHGAESDNILSDSDFIIFHNTDQWQKLKDLLIKSYLDDIPYIKNKDLSVQLWLLGIADQSNRTLKRNDKRKYPVRNTKEWKLLIKQLKKEEKERTNFIMNLVNNSYWPLYSDVGQTAGYAAMGIVQHSNSRKLVKKALPLIKSAVNKNEADKEIYALVLDRYLVHRKKKQIYGTQIVSFGMGRDQNGKQIFSEWFFYPIENDTEVNSRRKEMGLSTIEELAKKRNIESIYFPNGRNLSFRKQLKLQKSIMKPLDIE